MKTLDAPACQLLRQRLNETLAPLGQELHVALAAKNASYNREGTLATFKLEVAVIDAAGKAESREAADYKRLHALYRLPADGLGRTVNFAGLNYTILGLLPKSRRFPLLAGRDGKQYKLPLTALIP